MIDRNDPALAELIGEVIAARGLAQMLAFLLARREVVPADAIDASGSALAAMWSDVAESPDATQRAALSIAADRLAEFMADFRTLCAQADQGGRSRH